MKITVENSGTDVGRRGRNNARVSFGRCLQLVRLDRTAMNYSIFFNGTTFWFTMEGEDSRTG